MILKNTFFVHFLFCPYFQKRVLLRRIRVTGRLDHCDSLTEALILLELIFRVAVPILAKHVPHFELLFFNIDNIYIIKIIC